MAEGAQGDRVLAMQNALSAAGYDVGFPDGAFGPMTANGVREFQRDQGAPVTGEMTAAQFDAAVALAAKAPRCDEGLILDAIGRVPDGYDLGFSVRCGAGWAIATADSDFSSWFALLRVRGDRWSPVSERLGRIATNALAEGTPLGVIRFGELFGSPGWPGNVGSPEQIAEFIMEGALAEAGTGPGAAEEVDMWLDASGMDWWNTWWRDFGGPGALKGRCIYIDGVVDGPFGPGSGPYWECAWVDAAGYPGWLIFISPDFTVATMDFWGMD